VTVGARLLLVHAHPDDESILNGATIAAAVRAGVRVTLLTCTRGEAGEVLAADLAHLAGDGAALGAHRTVELATAMAALGVTDHRFLADERHPDGFRDSGMAGTAANQAPDSFARADLLDTATAVAAVIRDVRPHVLITYDEVGGYGHPDHVAAHRAAMYATQLAAAPYRPDLGERWGTPKTYWSALPRSVVAADLTRAGGGLPPGAVADPLLAADPARWRAHPDPAAQPAVDDALVTTRIDATAELPTKRAALRAHRSQLAVDGDRYALTNGIATALSGVEWYRLAAGRRGPVDGDGLETDLFAGLHLGATSTPVGGANRHAGTPAGWDR